MADPGTIGSAVLGVAFVVRVVDASLSVRTREATNSTARLGLHLLISAANADVELEHATASPPIYDDVIFGAGIFIDPLDGRPHTQRIAREVVSVVVAGQIIHPGSRLAYLSYVEQSVVARARSVGAISGVSCRGEEENRLGGRVAATLTSNEADSTGFATILAITDPSRRSTRPGGRLGRTLSILAADEADCTVVIVSTPPIAAPLFTNKAQGTICIYSAASYAAVFLANRSGLTTVVITTASDAIVVFAHRARTTARIISTPLDAEVVHANRTHPTVCILATPESALIFHADPIRAALVVGATISTLAIEAKFFVGAGTAAAFEFTATVRALAICTANLAGWAALVALATQLTHVVFTDRAGRTGDVSVAVGKLSGGARTEGGRQSKVARIPTTKAIDEDEIFRARGGSELDLGLQTVEVVVTGDGIALLAIGFTDVEHGVVARPSEADTYLGIFLRRQAVDARRASAAACTFIACLSANGASRRD